MKTCLIVACLVATAASIPAAFEGAYPEDAVVEEDLFQVEQDAASFESTRQMLEQMKANKKSDKACRQLADDTEKDVETSVKAQQDTLEKMDKGTQCPSKGKTEVAKAKSNLDDAKVDSKKKKKAYADSKKKKINFGDFSFDELTPGQCAIFFNKPVYINAKALVAVAKKASDKASGYQTAMQKSYDDALKKQKEAINKCQCAVKKLHADTVKSMNGKVEAANKKAWKHAADLRCILDGTPMSKCKVSTIPTVVPVKLTAATAAAKCIPISKTTCGSTATFAGQGSCNKKYSYQQVADFWCKRFGYRKATGWTKTNDGKKLCYIYDHANNWETMNPRSVAVKVAGFGCGNYNAGCRCMKNLRCA